MDRARFEAKLEGGRMLSFVYQPTPSNDLTGIIEIWKYQGKYIVTWEECHQGDQYNEDSYTRDERHLFASVGEAIAFLDHHKLDTASFD